MDAQPQPPAAAPHKALKYTGRMSKQEYIMGIPAQDLTADQVRDWLTAEQYQAALDSGWYKEATRTETKRIATDAEKASSE